MLVASSPRWRPSPRADGERQNVYSAAAGGRRGRSTAASLGASSAHADGLRVDQLDVEAQRAHLLDEHVEALGNARLERVVAAHDRLVDLGAAGHVVGLDGQHLLQRVGGAVGFERPHLHLAEALAAELRLAAQRLLGDEAVGADRAGVDLVVHQVVQLRAGTCSPPSPCDRTARPCARRRASPGPRCRSPPSSASRRCRARARRRTPASPPARRPSASRSAPPARRP